MAALAFAATATLPHAVLAQASPAPGHTPSAGPSAPAPSPTRSAATSNPAFSPLPAPKVDPAITARAKEWLHRLQTGNLDRTQLNADVNKQLTDALVKQAVAEIGPLGDPTDFTFAGTQSQQDITAYLYRVAFKTVAVTWFFALDPAGKIAGMQYGATR